MKTLYAVAADFAGHGIGNTALHAALGLWRAGHLARLACLSHHPTPIDETIIRDAPFLPDGLRRVIPDKAFYYVKNLNFDRAVRKMLREGFDTFHAWNSQATGAVGIAKETGVKVVIDRASFHIRAQTRILREAYARVGIRYEPTWERVIDRCLADYELADIVTVPSRPAYRSFIEEGYPEEKLVLNPFGIDFREDAPQATQDARDPFRVLFVGQVGIRKGAPDLLAAWDSLKLPGAVLTLVGGVEPAARRVFARYRNRPDVVFAGFSRDVPSHMAQSHAFCFPSLEEGSALVTYEAMSHGLPMVVTEEAGSVAEDGQSALFVPPADPAAIARAILRLYEDADEADRLGRAARERVRAFTWTAYGERTAQLHERVGKRGKG